MLYFDQFSEDRFGTVRQQIWSALHYPLHMAILLCVEGNTSLIVWNSAAQGLKWMWKMEPMSYSDPAHGFQDTADYLSYLNRSMYDINARFKSKYWNATYDWNRNFTAIENYTATYGFRTEEWNNKTGSIARRIFESAQVFVFEAHADSLAKLNAVTAPSSGPRNRLDGIFDVFNVTVMQFYIGGGAILLILAIMYWFNKLHKTKYEFGEMINRVVVGFSLMIVGVAAVIGNKTTSGFKFTVSEWVIPIVVLCLIAGKSLIRPTAKEKAYETTVLVFDNFLLAISSHLSRRRSHHRGGSWGESTVNNSPDDTVDLLSKYPNNSPNLDSGPPSAAFNKVHTSYSPYNSPQPPEQQFTAGASLRPGHDMYRTANSSAVTLNDIDGTGNMGFSYQNTPVSPLDHNGMNSGVITSTSYRQHSGEGNSKRNSRSGYDSLGVADEHDYDGNDYVQHPTRVRTIRDGAAF